MSNPLTRRDFLSAMAAAPLAAALASNTAGATSTRAPSFVVFLADDLGYGDLACFGHPAIKTPNLDQLAAEGMKLTDCYAAAPVCSPSRCGMLTGRTPNRLGIYDWIPPGSPMHLRRSEITIATLLKRISYATCHVGKWHCNGQFNSPRQPQPGDHGFDHWMATQNNAGPSHRNPVNFVRNGQRVGPIEGFSSTIIVDEAMSWLKSLKNPNQPFCLFVWFHATHEPVAAAEEFVRMYPKAISEDQAQYFGDVTQMDFEIGRLLKFLDQTNRRENTFVMFTSDNGPETFMRYPNAKRSHGSPGPLRGMKLHLYDGGIRVPGIIRFPGRTKPGSVSGEPVGFTDLLPTLCEIAAAQVPNDRAIDGASFVPIFSGQAVQRKTPMYWEYDVALSKPKVAIRQGDWKLLAAVGPEGNPHDFELYNLRNDIGEKKDLALAEKERVVRMSGELIAMYHQVKAEGPTWPATTRPARSR